MIRQQWAVLAFTALLLWGAVLVLGPFLSAIGWAAILALVSWPVYRRIDTYLGKRGLYASLAMTSLLALVVILPVIVMGATLARDAVEAYQTLKASGNLSLDILKENYAALGRTAAQIPFIGSQLQGWLREIDLVQIQQWLQAGAGRILTFLAGTGRTVSDAVVTFSLTLFTIFFFYLSGQDLIRQVRQALHRLGGAEMVSLLDPISATVRAVVLGLILTGVAQGVLAGLGLWVAGIKVALILGVLVALLSVVQIPTPVVWFPCVVWLGATGQVWQAVGLFLWSALIVGTIDNFIKPAFISQGTGIPLLLVFFGVLGGLLAFGTIGIVLGPVILSLLLVLWKRWIEEPTTIPGAAEPMPSVTDS